MTFGNTTGPNSNLPAESSLSNYAHKADDKATGLERESDIGVNPDKKSTAHPGHTAEHAHMKGVDMSSDTAIREALDDKVTKQVQAAQTAFKTDAPRQNAIKKLVPGAYSGTAADVAKAKELIQPQLLTNRSAILNAYRQLTRVPGGRAAFAAIPFIGDIGGAAEASEREIKAAKTGNWTDEIQSQLAGLGQIPVIGAIGDLGNAVIDQFRYGTRGAQKALQSPYHQQ